MLPCGTGIISLYAFIYYFLFRDRFVRSFLIVKKNYDIETPDQNGQWYQPLLTLFAIDFYESNTEGTNFWNMLYILRLCNVDVLCIVFNVVIMFIIYYLCNISTSEKPDMTLCG